MPSSRLLMKMLSKSGSSAELWETLLAGGLQLDSIHHNILSSVVQ